MAINQQQMPEIKFNGKTISCEPGANLREVLVRHNIYPHNGSSRYLNCCGIGTCGTCAVIIEGKLAAPGSQEKFRLSMPPHRSQKGLRLACQVVVNSNLTVSKGEGFWGQLTPE